jgi:hypothetical protein
LQDARAQGYTGSDAELRSIFDEHLADAREAVGVRAAGAAESGGGKSLLQAIRDLGGIGPDEAYQGELDRLWEGSSAYTPGKGWAKGANRLARGRMAGETGGFNGVTGVLKKQAEGPWGARTGGHSLDGMAELLRQKGPQFAHITGPNELLAALEPATRPGAGEAAGPSLIGALEQSGVKPGTRWWEVSFDPAELEAQLQAEQAAKIGQRISDAQMQEIIKHPAMGVVGRILNAPEHDVPFYARHVWKSQLQQGISGSYDDVVKSQVTNITQHLAGLLRKSLSGHQPYNVATRAYEKIAPLFTEGHAPLIKQVAIDAPEKIVQAIRMDQPTAVKMLVDVLTSQAAAGGGEVEGRQALQSVQAAWMHQNVLKDGIAKLPERLADLKAHPEFVEAFLGDADAKEVLKNLDTVSALFQRLTKDAEEQIARTGAAGELATQRAQELGKTHAARVEAAGSLAEQRARAISEEVVAQTRAAGELAKQRARETGVAAASATRAQGRAEQEALRRSHEALKTTQAEKVAGTREAIRVARQPTPQETAFLKSSLSPKRVRDPVQVSADLFHSILRSGTYYGGLGIARLAIGASEKDLLQYIIYSKSPVMRAFVRHVAASAKPGWAIAQLGRGLAPSPRALIGAIGEPPPRPTPPPRRQQEAR